MKRDFVKESFRPLCCESVSAAAAPTAAAAAFFSALQPE